MKKLFITLFLLALLSVQAQANELLTPSDIICAKNASLNLDALIANCLRAGAPVIDCEIAPQVRMNHIKKQCGLSEEGCRVWAKRLSLGAGIPAQDTDKLAAGCGPENATTAVGGDGDTSELGS